MHKVEPGVNLEAIRASGSRPPLFWIHGETSNAHLADSLEPDQPLYALKHQGRHGERVLYQDVETIAAHYLTQVVAVQPEGPYFLGGYSFGGTVAFEMARQLHKRGQTVALLFIIDSLSPGTRTRDRVSDSFSGAGTNRSHESPVSNVQHHFSELSQLDFRAMVGYMLVRLNDKAKDLVTNVTRALQGVLLPVFLATRRTLPYPLRSIYILQIYFDAIARYSPSPYPGRAIYIKSEQREPLHVHAWKKLMLGGLDIHELPGCDHRQIIDDAHAPMWLETLKRSLRHAREANGREGDAPQRRMLI